MYYFQKPDETASAARAVKFPDIATVGRVLMIFANPREAQKRNLLRPVCLQVGLDALEHHLLHSLDSTRRH